MGALDGGARLRRDFSRWGFGLCGIRRKTYDTQVESQLKHKLGRPRGSFAFSLKTVVFRSQAGPFVEKSTRGLKNERGGSYGAGLGD